MDVQEDVQEDVREGRESDAGADGTRGSVVAWVLTVAAALPVAVAGEASRRVMAGGLDRVFTATYGGYPSPSTSLRQRFEWLITSVPVGTALLASAMGVLVVAGLRLSGRDPGQGPRRAAAAVGGVVALGGLAFLAAVAQHVLRPSATTPATVAFVDTYPAFVQFGPQAAQVALTVVVSAAAAVSLLRAHRPVTAGPTPATGTAPPEPAAAPGPPAQDPPAPEPSTARPAAPGQQAQPVTLPELLAAAAPDAGPPPATRLPSPGAEDYALYRRPQP